MSEIRKEPENGQQMEHNAEFELLLKDFRYAVTHVAQRESEQVRSTGNEWVAAARRRERRRMTLAWSLCAAVICCVALLPVYSREFRAASRPAAAAAASSASDQAYASPEAAPTAESDATLLNAVDTDISASVPPSLAPLVVMEDWDSASADTSSAPAATNGSTLNSTENTNVAH